MHLHHTFAYFSQIWAYGSDPYTTSKSIPSCPFAIGNGICDTSLENLTDPCPSPTLSGNGICNSENNHAICNYDDGDCCPNKDLIGNGLCDYVNYNHACHFDGGDCCYFDSWIGDDRCILYYHNIEMCNYDQGDCCDRYRIADGICDDTNNNRICHYDGGDCCFGLKNTDRCSMCNCIDVFNVILIF